MERRPAVGSKCGVGILHVCQVKDHHQERSDNNIDCSPSHLAHYIKKTVTVRFILDHPVYYRNGYSKTVILHLNIDGAPKLKKCFYFNYGVLNLRRQFFTSLT